MEACHLLPPKLKPTTAIPIPYHPAARGTQLSVTGKASSSTNRARSSSSSLPSSTSKAQADNCYPYSLSTMEAPLQQFPVPPPPPLALPQDALLQQAVAARALLLAAAGTKAPSSSSLAAPAVPGPGRERCPRCASRDTKFCYYNNYNTAQPRHFCRACRRYWTLGGSLRNVPVGGATRKRHTRATAMPTTATTASSVCSPFAATSATLQSAAGGSLQLSSLLLGSVSASPLLALGAAPLLEGRLGFDDLGLGEAAALGTAADMARYQTLPLGAGPLPWPAAAILEGDSAESTTWTAASTSSVFPFPPAAALWQELAMEVPAVEGGGLGLHHGATPPSTCSCDTLTR